MTRDELKSTGIGCLALGVLLIALVLATGYGLDSDDGGWRWVYRLILAALVAALLFGYSRGRRRR